MKYINKNLLILSLILAFGTGLLYTSPVQAETEPETTESAERNNTASTRKTERNKTSNLDTWLKTCLTMGKNLHKYGFRYSNSGAKSSYEAALSSRRRTNCALYVSWCLQQYGALKKGQTFYIKGHGRIKKNFSKWDSNKVKIIKVYKRCSSVKLKPGDVTCWAGTPHACIYAGRNKAGKSMWYDGGKVATYSNRNGARYKAFTVRHLGYLDRRTISYIIRIKDL